jgi:hypothetical protein
VASASLRLSALAARPAQNLLRFRFHWPPAGGAQSSFRSHPHTLIAAHESSVHDLVCPILSSVSVFQARAHRCRRQFSRQPDLLHIFLLHFASTLACCRAWCCSPADSVKASKLAFLPSVRCFDFSAVLSRPNIAQAKRFSNFVRILAGGDQSYLELPDQRTRGFWVQIVSTWRFLEHACKVFGEMPVST